MWKRNNFQDIILHRVRSDAESFRLDKYSLDLNNHVGNCSFLINTSLQLSIGNNFNRNNFYLYCHLQIIGITFQMDACRQVFLFILRMIELEKINLRNTYPTITILQFEPNLRVLEVNVSPVNDTTSTTNFLYHKLPTKNYKLVYNMNKP